MALSGKRLPQPLDLRSVNRKRDALIQLYRDAEQSLSKRIAEDLAADRIGSAAYRTKRLAVIQAELSALQDATIPDATALVVNAYTTAAAETAQRTGIGAVDFGTALHSEALGTLADNITADLNGAAETVGRRVADVYRREGLRANARMAVENLTRKEASGFLVSSLVEQGVTSFVDQSGREWGLARYSEMVCRTLNSESANQGVVNTLVEAGIDLVEIAVADPCPICAEYEGNVYSLSGTTDGYDALDDQPPFHPNCECTLVASQEELLR
jgi:hypothetical protein